MYVCVGPTLQDRDFQVSCLVFLHARVKFERNFVLANVMQKLKIYG